MSPAKQRLLARLDAVNATLRTLRDVLAREEMSDDLCAALEARAAGLATASSREVFAMRDLVLGGVPGQPGGVA